MAVKEELKKLGLHFIVPDMGMVDVMEKISPRQRKQIKAGLLQSGLELIDNKNTLLIEKVKNNIVDIVHQPDALPNTSFSEYISKTTGYDYTYLASLFSDIQGTTIEEFIMFHKIERVKELIIYNELNLKDIATKLQFNSVAQLSQQFKKVTGLCPSYFKMLRSKRQKTIEETVGNPTQER
jgi:AraC-like DNA-binding protein